jgi:flagellar protein FliL
MSSAQNAANTAANATANNAAAKTPAKSKKKLFIVIAAVLALLVLGAGGLLLMKKKAADAEADNDETAHAVATAQVKHDPKAVPAFVPLDPFTVNLADRQAERYAQVGVTLELVDAKLAEQIKNYMPAIRNNILMAIADRTAAELLDREGKDALAEKIKKEASRAMGFAVADDEDEDNNAPAKADKPAKKAKKKPAPPPLPIKAVHFSNFIVQ